MQPQTVEPSSERTIHNLAREALAECAGDTKLATQQIVKWLNDDKALLKNVVSHAVHQAAMNAVGNKINNQRQALGRAATRVISGKDQVMALAGGIAASLLDFPLSGGVKLAMATREQVIAAASHYETMTADMSHKARWLRLIAQSVPDGKIVGAVITPDRALELYRETQNA